MKVKAKRLISLLLVLVMVFSMIPTALAAELTEAGTPSDVAADFITEPTVTTEISTEPTAVTEAPDVTEPSEVVEATGPSEATEVTEPSEETAATAPSEEAETTEPSEEATVTDPSEATEATEPSEETAATDPSEAAEATEPSEEAAVTDPSEATEATDPSEETAASAPSEATDATEPSEEPEPTLPVSDPTADVESAAAWEATMADVSLTDNAATNLVAIAKSQLGYTESACNFVIEGEGENTVLNGYTRYGAWYGLPYGEWCAMFVSFCIQYAGIEGVPYGAGCQTWIDSLTEVGLYTAAGNYIPTPGDVVFFDPDGDGTADHVGIVTEIAESGYVTIEGNYSNMVSYVEHTSDDNVLGFVSFDSSEEAAGVTVYGQLIVPGAPPATYALARDTGSGTLSDIQGTRLSAAAIWFNNPSTLNFGNGHSTQSMFVHTVELADGTVKPAYCIEAGVTPGSGYTGATNGWHSLPSNTQRALGTVLMYGAPNCYTSDMSLMEQMAYHAATQVIVHEIVLGWRNDTSPYTRTNDAYYKAATSGNDSSGRMDITVDSSESIYWSLRNKNNSGYISGRSGFDKDLFKEAYEYIVGKISQHDILPSFAMKQSYGSRTYTLKLQSNGTYVYEISLSETDVQLLSSGAVKMVNGNGLTYRRSGTKLIITANEYFSGVKSCAYNGTSGVYKDVPEPENQTYLLWSSGSYQDLVQHYAYRDDPMRLYFNVKAEDLPASMTLKKVAVDENGNVLPNGDVEGYGFYLKKSDGAEWRMKTDSKGVACNAQLVDGKYVINGDSTMDNITPGTYDLLEVVSIKGTGGTEYPVKITIDIKNKNGASVAGWPKTYTGVNGNNTYPTVATAGNGATGKITFDNSVWENARLNNIEFTAADLAGGNTIIVEVQNQKVPNRMRIVKTAESGVSVVGYDFKLWNRSTGRTWTMKTDTSGTGRKATVNSDGTYSIVQGSNNDVLTGITAGEYDLLEVLANQGSGVVYPTSITISLLESNGTTVSGWPKTYYAPGGANSVPPIVQQGTGAKGTITLEQNADGTVNARLNNISFSSGDIRPGRTIVVTINNTPPEGELSLLKTSTAGVVGDVCFKFWRWGYDGLQGKNYYIKTDANGVGYEATYSTDASGNATYTRTSKKITNFTNGTYDIIEDLKAMGLTGVVFPSSWKVSVYDKNNTLVNTKTYYPGNDPGATITKDDNGNPRLRATITGLTEGGYVRMEINNAPCPAPAYIRKTADDGNVAGACFGLYNWDNGLNQYVITDASGEGYAATITRDENNNRVYTMTEIRGFDGLTNGTYDFVEDLKAMGVLGTVFPTSWTITVYDKNGNVTASNTYYPGEVSGENITTDSDGNARLRMVKVEGITDGGYIEMVVNNAPITAPAYIKKTSSNGNVADACFGLYNWDTKLNLSVKTDASGEGYAATTTVDASGKKVYTITDTKGFEGLTNGTYDFVEDLKAMGVMGTVFPTSWTITVFDKDGNEVNTTTYYPGTVYGESITTDSDGNARLHQITIEGITDGGYIEMEINNEVTVGEISAEKVGPDGKHLAGAKFKLEWSEDGLNWSPVSYSATNNYKGSCSTAGLDKDGCLVTKATGIVTFEDLNSTLYYRLTEVEAPKGYKLPTDPVAYEGKLPTETDFIASVTVINYPIGEISVEKVDPKGNHLAGAKFKLEWSEDSLNWSPVSYSATDIKKGSCSTEGLDKDGCLVTADDGVVTFKDLDGTLYYRVTEVEAPEGFMLPENPIAFEGLLPAETNFIASVTVVNIPAGKISIEKVDPYGNHLAGAKFKLEWSEDGLAWSPVFFSDTDITKGSCSTVGLDEDGCLVTKEDGIVTFESLDPTLFYRLTEVDAPEGYTLLTAPAFKGQLPAEDDNLVTLVVVNHTEFELTPAGSTELSHTVGFGSFLMIAGLFIAMAVIAIPAKSKKD